MAVRNFWAKSLVGEKHFIKYKNQVNPTVNGYLTLFRDGKGKGNEGKNVGNIILFA